MVTVTGKIAADCKLEELPDLEADGVPLAKSAIEVEVCDEPTLFGDEMKVPKGAVNGSLVIAVPRSKKIEVEETMLLVLIDGLGVTWSFDASRLPSLSIVGQIRSKLSLIISLCQHPSYHPDDLVYPCTALRFKASLCHLERVH
jgi:hypothetical protein